MKKLISLIIIMSFVFLFVSLTSAADIPMMLNYQGYVEDVSGVPINSGYFKFAIVDDPNGTTTYWSNDDTSTIGDEPEKAVMIPVSNGFFTIKLGDTGMTNMSSPLTTFAFAQQNICVRVWFSDDNVSFDLLSPDTQIVSSGFAYKAQSVVDIQDGTITNADISSDAKIDASKIDLTDLSEADVENYIANEIGKNYVPRNNNDGTKLVKGTIYDNGTKVGIGTDSPNQKLDVHGGIAIDGLEVINDQGEWVGSTTGLVGPEGAQGLQGLKGDTGDTGLQGAQGLQGLKGDTGDTGLQGAQGLQGLKGDTGDIGPQGLSGEGDGHSLDAADGSPLDAVYVDNTGNIGIGTDTPSAKLHVSGEGDQRVAINSTDTGEAYLNTYNKNGTWRFGTNTDGAFFIKNEVCLFLPYPPYKYCTYINRIFIDTSGNIGIGTVEPEGKLDVNGTIYQRGTSLHADYVFEPDYKLETIEEHAKFMWNNKHLKSIPKAKADENGQEIVEVGAHRKGIVEELEKAHIYIEQLHKRMKEMDKKMAALEARFNEEQ